MAHRRAKLTLLRGRLLVDRILVDRMAVAHAAHVVGVNRRTGWKLLAGSRPRARPGSRT
jgi:hypothetical protein